MKITSTGVDPTIAIATTHQGQHSDIAHTQPHTPVASVQPQVQLLLDNQVKLLLAEVTALLRQQADSLAQLPPAVAQTADQLLHEPLQGEKLVPQGLTAMLNGQKSAVQNLLLLAGVLKDAAVVKQYFPDGLSDALRKTLNAFESQITRLGDDPTSTLLTLATQLAASEKPVHKAPLVLEQLCRQLQSDQSGQQGTGQSPASLAKMFAQLADDFSSQLIPFTTSVHERNLLITVFRQTAQQLLSTYTDTPDGQLPGLPAIMDKLLESFDLQLIKLNPALEKDIMATDLRQISRQMADSLSVGERQSLQQLISLLQDDVPAKLNQAALQHNLPELKEAWVLLKMASAKEWLNLPTDVLLKSSQNVHEMAASLLRGATDQSGDQGNKQNSITLAMPLYFGEEARPYPAYIHISQDQERRNSAADFVPETWLRLCMATDNIGIVNMIFHVYGNNQLNIKVVFSDVGAAEDFASSVPDIEAKLAESPFTLGDISIAAMPNE